MESCVNVKTAHSQEKKLVLFHMFVWAGLARVAGLLLQAVYVQLASFDGFNVVTTEVCVSLSLNMT